jgi:RNA polymerase sigma-70 factor (ECF subfamily)
MVAFQEGDEEAFVELYRRYRDKLFNFARRLLRDPTLAEEATQDVLLKLYGARVSYVPRSRFSTFIFRIATNHCLNLLARKERRVIDRKQLVDAAADPAANPEDRAAAGEVREAVEVALAALPEKQAAALLLSHHEGLSHQEIGEVLGVSVSAVKSLVFRARESMMKKLSPEIAQLGADHAL